MSDFQSTGANTCLCVLADCQCAAAGLGTDPGPARPFGDRRLLEVSLAARRTSPDADTALSLSSTVLEQEDPVQWKEWIEFPDSPSESAHDTGLAHPITRYPVLANAFPNVPPCLTADTGLLDTDTTGSHDVSIAPRYFSQENLAILTTSATYGHIDPVGDAGLNHPAAGNLPFADGVAAHRATLSTPIAFGDMSGGIDVPRSSRHHCPDCSNSYGRASDLVRHQRVHDPSAARHSCPFPGCDRTGSNGFLRLDKLMEHRRIRRH